MRAVGTGVRPVLDFFFFLRVGWVVDVLVVGVVVGVGEWVSFLEGLVTRGGRLLVEKVGVSVGVVVGFFVVLVGGGETSIGL